MNIANLFVRAARGHGAQPALALGDDVLCSYGELARRGAVIAGQLRAALGLAPGERAALVMGNLPDYVELLLAGWYAGLTMVPVNAKLHPRELAYILGHSGARVCFASADLIGAVGPLADELAGLRVIEVGGREHQALRRGDPAALTATAADAVAWLFYTSGTTGRPKGAMLSHRNLLAMTLSYFADVDRIAPGDAIVHAAPMSHGSGCYILPHAAQAACQVVPASGGFDPAEIFALLARRRGRHACSRRRRWSGGSPPTRPPAAPTTRASRPSSMAAGRCTRPTSSGRTRSSAIAWRRSTARARARCASPRSTRRATPRSPTRATAPGSPRSAAPQLVVEVIVADGEDRPLPPGAPGEVLVRGDSVMLGYWQDAEASARTLRGGWLHTGDIGVLDEDGFLTLRDRAKDLIISGGANIYPREVEETLLQHPAVAEVAVVGAPDADWGETVVAFVVLAPDAQPPPASSMPTASPASPASSGRRTTASSRPCPRTTTARCSRPSCASGSGRTTPEPAQLDRRSTSPAGTQRLHWKLRASIVHWNSSRGMRG